MTTPCALACSSRSRSQGRRWAALALALAGMFLAGVAEAAPLKLEGVAVLMRHGVRPPTKAQPMPEGMAADAWPQWTVAPGELTLHGAEAIRLAAAQDRALYARRGLAPATGCLPASDVEIWADVDQRTVKTGEAWAEGFAPGCGLKTGRAPGDHDPLFSPLDGGHAPFSPEAAVAAVNARLPAGGVAEVAARRHALLERLSHVLGCCAAPVCDRFEARAPCGLADLPTGLTAPPGRRPKLDGALDLASTASQILLLEYGDGKSGQEVGWGRATAADIRDFSALHALEFEILARPSLVAAANGGPIARRLLQAVESAGQPGAPRIVMLMGHDTNVANIGGLLDLHWSIDGFAADDPAPGGQLGFERLRAADGRRYVRVFYQAQPLELIRSLSPAAPTRQYLKIPGCDAGPEGACPLAQFRTLVTKAVPAG